MVTVGTITINLLALCEKIHLPIELNLPDLIGTEQINFFALIYLAFLLKLCCGSYNNNNNNSYNQLHYHSRHIFLTQRLY